MSDKLKEWQFNLNDIRPTIRNGMWWIGEVNTGVSADGLPGAPGEDGQPGESIYISNVSTNAQGGKVILFSDGTTVIIPKGDKGEPGRDADPASSTDTLDDVNNRGNVTEKDINVKQPGKGSWRTALTPFGVQMFQEDELKASISGTVNSHGEGQLTFGRNGANGGSMAPQRNDRAGMAFNSRVSGQKALNSIDFVTLSQLKSYDAEIVDTPVYTFQKNKDVIIITTTGVTIDLPEIHSSEYEEWNGKKLKIVAHKEVAISRSYIDSSGKSENNIVSPGNPVELMFLNNQWYAI